MCRQLKSPTTRKGGWSREIRVSKATKSMGGKGRSRLKSDPAAKKGANNCAWDSGLKGRYGIRYFLMDKCSRNIKGV